MKRRKNILTLLICPICQDKLVDPITTECGHSACLLCFEKFKQFNQASNQQLSCPSGCGRKLQLRAYSRSIILNNLMSAILGIPVGPVNFISTTINSNPILTNAAVDVNPNPNPNPNPEIHWGGIALV